MNGLLQELLLLDLRLQTGLQVPSVPIQQHSCKDFGIHLAMRDWTAASTAQLLTRGQVLHLWSGSTDAKTRDYQRTNPREYQTVRTHTIETT